MTEPTGKKRYTVRKVDGVWGVLLIEDWGGTEIYEFRSWKETMDWVQVDRFVNGRR
jgi:hypothetical protein